MEKKENAPYTAPEIKVAMTEDVITTSTALGDDGTPDYDKDGWA